MHKLIKKLPKDKNLSMCQSMWHCTNDVCVSVCMYQRGSQRADLHKIWHLGLTWKFVKKIQTCLKKAKILSMLH